MTHLDEKALAAKAWADLEMAASATGALEVARITLPIEKVRALVNERSALPSSPVSELVDALMEWSRPDTGSHDAGVQLVCEQAASTLTTLSARNAELEREVKRLREALKPFSEAADELDERAQDRHDLWEHPVAMNITVAHLREAHRALSISPQGGEHE